MNTKYRKKLIEVAMPLAALSDAGAREKDIHVGLPANFHSWWSRKPLSAARAVILASLIDDPGPEFSEKERARRRHKLFDLIARVADPEGLIDKARIKEAQKALKEALGGRSPTICDPFCGGGSIPLEGHRLGLDVLANDLNPVAVAITRAMIELLPASSGRRPVSKSEGAQKEALSGSGSAYDGVRTDVAFYAEWMKAEAAKRLGQYFPPAVVSKKEGSEEAIAWVWARTVKCSNPSCGANAPLVNKFWLSTHRGNTAWAEPKVNRSAHTVEFRIKTEGTPPPGTVGKRGARCLVCEQPISLDHIRKEGQRGRLDAQLMAVVVSIAKKRRYLEATPEQEKAARQPKPSWIPDTELPERALGFRVQNYGLTRHADLFTRRQLATLAEFSGLVELARARVLKDSGGDEKYADTVALLLAFAVDRLAQTNCTLVRWLVRASGTSKGTPAMDRPIVPMSWEFSEGNPFGESVGSWEAAVENVLSAIKSFSSAGGSARAVQGNAADFIDSVQVEGDLVISTDPPYYDNIGYSALSDFYYVWLRRSVGKRFPDLFGTILVPKKEELVAGAESFGGDRDAARVHFTEGLKRAFSAIAKRASADYPVTVYYAFKQSESEDGDDTDDVAGQTRVASTGWETLLESLIESGFAITGTWPLRTEQRKRLRAIDSNALASSIVLVCRPRSRSAPVCTRGEFVAMLRDELPVALDVLRTENIAPVDLPQAAIGPGIAVFSRHAKVLEADGSAMAVRTALQLINRAVDEHTNAGQGDLDKDTQFAVTWFESHGFEKGPFGDAENLAKARNVAVSGLREAGILRASSGDVRLLARSELSKRWSPESDSRVSAWECMQHLIKRLEEEGEEAAAGLLHEVGPLADPVRDLAYRMFSICERKRWAEEARAYNGLVTSWPEIERLSASKIPEQRTLL